MLEKWIPDGYQKDGVKKLVDNPCFGLFWKPGVSKTSPTLDAFCKLKKKGLVKRALIVSTAEIISNTGPWHGEVNKWANFNHLKLVTLEGPKKDELAEKKADIYLISNHVKILEWFFWDKELHKKLRIDWLIVDESTYFKNPRATCFKGYPKQKRKTVRFPGLRNYVEYFKRRTILTGDPRPKSLTDLWSQIYLLDAGATLERFITHFENKYFSVGRDGWTLTPLPGAVDRVYELIDKLIMVVDDDVLELPDLEFIEIPIQLPAEARKAYNEMEKDFILETVKGNRVVAPSKAVSGGYLRQIANGGLYYHEMKDLPDGRQIKGKRKIVEYHSAKTSALIDLIGKLDGQQLLVSYEFAHDLERIKRDFKDSWIEDNLNVVYYTTSSKRKKDMIKKDWNAGKVDIIVTQLNRLSHGLNLQESNASNVCLFSQMWRVEAINQFIRRLRRRGNTSASVNVYALVCENTYDELVFDNIAEKNGDQQKLYDDLKSYILDRSKRYKKRRTRNATTNGARC